MPYLFVELLLTSIRSHFTSPNVWVWDSLLQITIHKINCIWNLFSHVYLFLNFSCRFCTIFLPFIHTYRVVLRFLGFLFNYRVWYYCFSFCQPVTFHKINLLKFRLTKNDYLKTAYKFCPLGVSAMKRIKFSKIIKKLVFSNTFLNIRGSRIEGQF